MRKHDVLIYRYREKYPRCVPEKKKNNLSRFIRFKQVSQQINRSISFNNKGSPYTNYRSFNDQRIDRWNRS